jgi:RNA polymerase sigma factor (sigma-70 family)
VEASAIGAPPGLGRLTARGPLLRVRSDDQLVALFRMGFDDAFGVIHDRYRARLLAYTRQMLGGSGADAEDVMQDVFLRAYDALRRDDRPVTLRAWLYRVAHNRCIDQLRRPLPPVADIFAAGRAPLRDPSGECERRDAIRHLVSDVRRLPESQRSALLMREMDGLSYAEIADAMSVSVPAIKSLLVRARLGLIEATEARDATCEEIRTDMALARDRGARASARARRHVRDCAGCREYRGTLRVIERRLGALSPGGGPLSTIAKLLGIGAGGSGAAAGGGIAAGGTATAVVGSGAATVTATKVVALVCCAALAGGVAEVDRHHASPARARHATLPVVAPPTLKVADPTRDAAALPRAASVPTVPAAPSEPEVPATDPPPSADLPADAQQAAPSADEQATGGMLAPDEEPADTTISGDPASATADPSSAGASTTTTPSGTQVGAPSGGSTSSGSSTSTTTTTSQPADGPSGQVSGGAPVAQGASAPS